MTEISLIVTLNNQFTLPYLYAELTFLLFQPLGFGTSDQFQHLELNDAIQIVYIVTCSFTGVLSMLNNYKHLYLSVIYSLFMSKLTIEF